MREIKFRAWLKETKEMIPVYQIDFNNGIINSESAWRTEIEYILEQFTGLHDSTTWKELTEQERKDWTMKGHMPSEWRGREVYEGDIVEFINIDRQYVKGIVYYFGSCFLIQSIVADEDDYNLGGAFSIAKGLIKVIGTIHDNPELLEE